MLNGVYSLISLHILALIWVSMLYIPPQKIRWSFLWFFQILVTEWIFLSILWAFGLPWLHPSFLWFSLLVLFYVLGLNIHLRTHNIFTENTQALKSLAHYTLADFIQNIYPFRKASKAEVIQEPSQKLEHLYFRCEKPIALCIHIHGGAWKYGDATQLAVVADLFNQENIEVISINYKKYPDAQLAEIMKSVEQSFLFLKNTFSNSNKVILYGRSAGGHLALMLSSLHPEMIDKVVALYPVTDLPALTKEPTNDLLKSPEWVKQVTGVDYNDQPELYRNLSPCYNLQKNAPPLLLIHGANDPVVSIQQSNSLYKMASSYNRSTVYLAFDKATHGFDALWRGLSMTAFKKALIAFLKMKQS